MAHIIRSKHPDLDEIVRVTAEGNDMLTVRVQVPNTTLDECEPERTGSLVSVEQSEANAEVSNVTFSTHRELFAPLADYIAENFLTYDDSMGDALRKIDLDQQA